MPQNVYLRKMFAASLPIVALMMAMILSSAAQGQEARVVTDDEWCENDGWRGERDRHCEVREISLDTGALRVDGRNNGGISVEAWDRDEILVRAKVVGDDEDGADEARELARRVEVLTDGREVRSEGPDTGRDESWWVSYRVYVPRDTDLDLETHNGGIAIVGVNGHVRFKTHNGGVHVADAAGDVQGETRNGGVNVELTGTAWEGAGLDVTTRNGGVKVLVPRDYDADFETGTRNGGMTINFPVSVSGEIGRHVKTTLGNGGAPVRVITTNGGVRVDRRS